MQGLPPRVGKSSVGSKGMFTCSQEQILMRTWAQVSVQAHYLLPKCILMPRISYNLWSRPCAGSPILDHLF